MKKQLLLLATSLFLISGASFAQTGKDAQKVKKDSTSVSTAHAAKKPMLKACPGKTCGKTKS